MELTAHQRMLVLRALSERVITLERRIANVRPYATNDAQIRELKHVKEIMEIIRWQNAFETVDIYFNK